MSPPPRVLWCFVPSAGRLGSGYRLSRFHRHSVSVAVRLEVLVVLGWSSVRFCLAGLGWGAGGIGGVPGPRGFIGIRLLWPWVCSCCRTYLVLVAMRQGSSLVLSVASAAEARLHRHSCCGWVSGPFVGGCCPFVRIRASGSRFHLHSCCGRVAS